MATLHRDVFFENRDPLKGDGIKTPPVVWTPDATSSTGTPTLKTETRLKGMESRRFPIAYPPSPKLDFENRDPLKGDGIGRGRGAHGAHDLPHFENRDPLKGDGIVCSTYFSVMRFPRPLKTETRLKGMESGPAARRQAGKAFENRDPLKGDGNSAFIRRLARYTSPRTFENRDPLKGDGNKMPVPKRPGTCAVRL